MRQIVCKVSDLAPGEVQASQLGTTPIVLCRASDGQFYAFSNRCPHQGAPLSKGVLCGAPEPTNTPGEYKYDREGEILRCPWHGREFDVKNKGSMLAEPLRSLPEFKIEIEDENVFVVR